MKKVIGWVLVGIMFGLPIALVMVRTVMVGGPK